MSSRTLKAFAPVVPFLLVLAGCAATPPSETGDLIDPGTLTICINPEYPPMEYLEHGSDGDLIGFDVEIARAVADDWGVEPRFEVTAFDGLMPALQAERCDLLWSGIYLNEERLKVADGVPLLKSGSAFVVLAENADRFVEKQDFCGANLAALIASTPEIQLQELAEWCTAEGLPEPVISTYPKSAELVLSVQSGKADAMLEGDVSSAYIVEENGSQFALVSGVFGTDDQYAVYVRKGSPLKERLEATLVELGSDGTLNEIAKTYGLDPANIAVE